MSGQNGFHTREGDGKGQSNISVFVHDFGACFELEEQEEEESFFFLILSRAEEGDRNQFHSWVSLAGSIHKSLSDQMLSKFFTIVLRQSSPAYS